jgi:MerR family mercuric resistance operon transcriptional regulator
MVVKDSLAPQKLVFTIGTLAQEASVNVETIRYYQKRGLLRQPEKSPNGVRYYNSCDLTRLQLIRRAKRLRFTLSEIAKLVPLVEDGNCHAARALAQGKLEGIDDQIALLELVRQTLVTLVGDCTRNCGDSCAFIDGLRQDFGLHGA